MLICKDFLIFNFKCLILGKSSFGNNESIDSVKKTNSFLNSKTQNQLINPGFLDQSNNVTTDDTIFCLVSF